MDVSARICLLVFKCAQCVFIVVFCVRVILKAHLPLQAEQNWLRKTACMCLPVPGETLSPGGGIQVTVVQAESYANGQMTERVLQVGGLATYAVHMIGGQ